MRPVLRRGPPHGRHGAGTPQAPVAALSARAVSTVARCVGTPADPCRSLGGRCPRRPAPPRRGTRPRRRGPPADARPPPRVARTGSGPMLVSADPRLLDPSPLRAHRGTRRRRSPRPARSGGTSRSGSPSRDRASAPARRPGARRVPGPTSASRRRTPPPGSPARRPPTGRGTPRPAPARRPAGRPPGRRAPATRRTCPGGVRPGRRPSRWPCASSGTCSRDQRVAHHLVVRGHRADDQRVALVADPAQLRQPADVDERVG